MKKCITILCLLLCIILFTSCAGREEEEPAYTLDPALLEDPTTAPTEAPVFPEDFAPDLITPEQQPEELAGYESYIVQMAAKMPPEDQIWRDPVLHPDDPEYDPIEKEIPTPMSQEGKVYANDRIIAIDIPHPNGEEILQYQFGYITGQYNRYLYLNPVCVQAKSDRPIGFYASISTVGQAALHWDDASTYADTPQEIFSLTHGLTSVLIPDHTYDYICRCTYHSPTKPGLCWYTPQALFEPYGVVNIRALDLSTSTTLALIRLYVAKDEETGTYYLHHAENRNLLQTGATEQVPQEMIDDAMAKTKAYLSSGEYEITNYDENESIFLVEYLDERYHDYYFDYLTPLYSEDNAHMDISQDMYLPAMAVTVCTGRYAGGPETFYFGAFGNYLQLLARDLKYAHDYENCLTRYQLFE